MDVIGKKFGRLTVIEYADMDGRHVMVKCKCDCGNYIVTREYRLISGTTKSCGCYRKDKLTKHGNRHTKLYHRWCSMRRRCTDSKNKWYNAYGGRGISVCEEWDKSFEAFYKWAQDNGYNESLTLDRIDNYGNYEPANCRWVTMKVQSNNRRSSRFIQYHDKTMTLAQWAEYTGIKSSTIWKRLHDRWPVGEALGFEPHQTIHRRNE